MIINTMKAIEEACKTRVNPRYSIYNQNVLDIIKNSSSAYEAIVRGFILGYAQGAKAAKAEMKKAKEAVAV